MVSGEESGRIPVFDGAEHISRPGTGYTFSAMSGRIHCGDAIQHPAQEPMRRSGLQPNTRILPVSMSLELDLIAVRLGQRSAGEQTLLGLVDTALSRRRESSAMFEKLPIRDRHLACARAFCMPRIAGNAQLHC